MINLIPPKDEVIKILQENGAYTHGYFVSPEGKHTSQAKRCGKHSES